MLSGAVSEEVNGDRYSVKGTTRSLLPIFPYPVKCIGQEKAGTSNRAIANIAVYLIGHGGGFHLVSGFATFGKAVFQIGFVDSCGMSVFAHHLQPGNVILVTVIVLHWKFQGYFTEEQYRGAVYAVVF